MTFGPPKRAVPTTLQWMQEAGSASASRSDFIHVDDESFARLRPVISVEPSNYYYEQYRVSNSEHTVARGADGHLYCRRTPKFVLVLEGGRALGPEGTVIGPDDTILSDLSPEFDSERAIPGEHSLLNTVRLPPPEYVAGTTVVLATLAQDYFAHWMMDLIPRIGLLREANIRLEDVDWFYLPAPTKPHQTESLRAAGIPLHRVLDCHSHPHICAESLVVPSPVNEVFRTSERSCKYLNELFAPRGIPKTTATGTGRIFVSRRSTGHRRILNEDALVGALTEQGFQVVQPESLTLDEQAALFARAEVIVAPLGSACANYVYCNPGAASSKFSLVT